MTRRKFIRNVGWAMPTIFGCAEHTLQSSAILVGTSWLTKKAVPCKFVWAIRLEKYPGRLRLLQDISKQNNWSG